MAAHQIKVTASHASLGWKQLADRSHIHAPQNLGDRAADRVNDSMGSWSYLILQTVFIAVWMSLNVVAWCYHWDPKPWIMLNLIFSIQASYASPLILLSNKRQAQKDRARDDHEAEEVSQLFHMQQQQLDLMEKQHEEMLTQLKDLLSGHDR